MFLLTIFCLDLEYWVCRPRGGMDFPQCPQSPRQLEGHYVSSLPALVSYLSINLAQQGVILCHDFGCCEQASREIVP